MAQWAQCGAKGAPPVEEEGTGIDKRLISKARRSTRLPYNKTDGRGLKVSSCINFFVESV